MIQLSLPSFLAFYLHSLSPFLIKFNDHLGIRWYGLAYVAAFIIGAILYRHLAVQRYSDLKPEEVADFITWGALFGVLLGGRLGYMLFYDWHNFITDPLLFFRVWEGGMASHGGIIGLALFSFWYARRHHYSWLNLGDNLVVVAPIGLFLGRCANFINGELFGRETTVSWAMQFPRELEFFPRRFLSQIIDQTSSMNPQWDSVTAIVQATPHSQELQNYLATILTPRYPSQLIEAFLEGVILFSLLWLMRTRLRLPNGVLTGTFFIAYAILRIIGEFFREPDAPLTGSMTRGQFLSLFLILIGIGFIIGAYLHPHFAPRFKTQTRE